MALWKESLPGGCQSLRVTESIPCSLLRAKGTEDRLTPALEASRSSEMECAMGQCKEVTVS